MLSRYAVFLFTLLILACTANTTNHYSLEQQTDSNEGDAMTMSEINPGLPSVGVKKTGWSAFGTLVAPQAVPPAVGSGEVSLQANFDEPGNYTLEFAVIVPSNFSFNRVQLATEAIITWAVEGNFISRRVTIANGTSVTGVGQAVKVKIVDVSEFTVGIDPPGSVFDYDVSMQVSRGSRAASGSPPIFCPISSQDNFAPATAGGVIAQIDVPRDAGINSVQVVGHRTSGANRFALLQGDIAIVQSAPISTSAYDYVDQAGNFIPLVPGATRIDIIGARSYAAPAEYHVTVILGVDG